MYCTLLSLKDFRGYSALEIGLARGISVFQGVNAAGKTTLLEALYLLATTRSPRTTSDQQLISFSAEADLGAPAFSRLKAKFTRKDDNFEAEVLILADDPLNNPGNTRKRVKINGAPRRSNELIGQINVVLFSPEDLEVVTGSPALRRRYLDITLSQIDSKYLVRWQNYQKVLAQRNGFLKTIKERREKIKRGNSSASREPAKPDTLKEELEVWNTELVKSGSYLLYCRALAIEQLNRHAAELHSHLLGYTLEVPEAERFRLRYAPSLPIATATDENQIAEIFATQLAASYADETRRGATLVGPHRDDFVFEAGERDIAVYGSRGQQRTAILALKLAEAAFMQETTGDLPILLLDDILSELDEYRRQYVLDTVRQRAEQILITTTDLTLFGNLADLQANAIIYQVADGKLSLLRS